jgi:hypothetical protein
VLTEKQIKQLAALCRYSAEEMGYTGKAKRQERDRLIRATIQEIGKQLSSKGDNKQSQNNGRSPEGFAQQDNC